MKISRELKTGIVALLSIVLFFWGFNFLKNRSIYDKTRTFYAEYPNVQGLSSNSPVTINGLGVGKISDISFHPSKKGILIVHITLTNNIEFSKNSVAEIYSPDFISGKSMRINLVYDEAHYAKNGDTLQGRVESGIMGMINEQIAPLQSKVESFVMISDSVMQNINQVLDDKNQENIKSSLQNLAVTLNNFKNISASADRLFIENNAKFDSILDNTNIAMGNFSQISDSLQKVDFGATVAKLNTTLDGLSRIMDSIENGQGTIGKLINDEQLYKNLEGASLEMEELLREFKLHPKRFVHFSVFGKKEKIYQEKEE